MANKRSIESIINELIGNGTNGNNNHQTSSSVGDCANRNDANPAGPSTSDKPENEEIEIQRTQSEPNNIRAYLIRTAPITFNHEVPELSTPRNLSVYPNDADSKKSKFSLHFQSEILNIANKSNVTVKSCIRFNEYDLPRPHQTASSARTELPPQRNTENSTRPIPDYNEMSTTMTVLCSENASFDSSESLIAKDSMGQSQLNLDELRSMNLHPRRTDLPKRNSASALVPCTTQPPPYHVATAHDSASVQLTPAAAPPLVLYSAPPLQGGPPTYSALMHVGPRESNISNRIFSRRDVQIQPSAPFIAPPPPPSYAQAQGYCVAHPLQFADPQDSIWNTEPVTVICPYCNNFVVTSVRFRRSNLTHYSALALCICGCWPCCLLPYCMKSCKCVHHECPICTNVVGVYSPWQVS